MTDVVRYQAPTNWIDVLGPAHEMAAAICRTEFVPSALRNRPEAVMACILAGDALGIHPMVALQKIHIIEGKPGPAAELQRAMVIAQGHDIWEEEVTNTRVVMCGRRRDSDHVSKVQWTMDDAKKAGLANKQNWQKYPRDMLIARASSQLCRLRFPDCLAGLSYSAEELGDGFGFDDRSVVVDADVVAEPEAIQAPSSRQRAPRKPAARRAAASAPAADPVPASSRPMPPLPGEDEPTGEITPSMRDDNFVAMRAKEAGVDHHVVVRAVTAGRASSAKDLDGDEKALVLAAIGDLADGRRVLSLTDADLPCLVGRDEGADVPPTDEQREMLSVELDALSKEAKEALAARVKGVVPSFRGDRFTVRHLFLTMDRLPQGDKAVAP